MTKYQRAADVVTRRVAGETLLVPVRRGPPPLEDGLRTMFIVLNSTGEALWEHLATPQDVDELARYLSQAFEVTLDRARDDVDAFLQDLVSARAVQQVPEGG